MSKEHQMDQSTDDLQFSWGKKRGRGGAKMDIQFYESFVFDHVNYSLYDCVYLFKHGDPDPYIGKIVKIWEQPDHAKKVKILWFFFPNEIQNHLRDHTMEKEVFLASGEGIGLADINPLEAIAGKCSVICISKDERNRQPSSKEQEMADYRFYRIFDVRSCTLSEELPNKIAGVEVKFLLNPQEDQQTNPVPKLELGGGDPKAGSLRILDNGNDRSRHLPMGNDGEGKHLKGSDDHPDEKAPLKLRNVVVKEATNNVDGNKSIKNKSHPNLSSEKPSKKIKFSHDQAPSAGDMQIQAGERNSVVEFDQDAIDSKPTLELHSEKMKLIESNLKNSDEPFQKAIPATSEKKAHPEVGEVTARPAADRRKWFKDLPWNDRLQNADQQGTLVYIQNLDVNFAPSDIENLIHSALQLYCTAKSINHPTYDDPNNGKAYIIFKTREAADQAVSKINAGLLVGARPLYCSRGLLKVPKPSSMLAGHLSTEKIRKFQSRREEQRKAVSTSHCSQPNTIEYDMALEWILQREKQDRNFRTLHKNHSEERKQFAKRLRSK